MSSPARNSSLQDNSNMNTTVTSTNVTKPKRRSLVERELETNMTAKVTTAASGSEGRTSRYGRTRVPKIESELSGTEKSPLNVQTPVKSPAYKIYASNSAKKLDTREVTIPIKIEDQIETIYSKNISLSRFGSAENANSPAKKFGKVYTRKDLIQGKEREETSSIIKNTFSQSESPYKPSTSTHLSNILERSEKCSLDSAEKYTSCSSDNTKRNLYEGTPSVVKTLDFDSGKKAKKEVNKNTISKSEIFEIEAQCLYQVGDLGWARVGTYPFWPCIVTRDPYSGTFVKRKLFGRVVRDVLHVTFFGDNGRRGWIVENMMRKYSGLKEFHTTKDNITPEDKKKDPKYYAAFFISEKKLVTWANSVEEADRLLREPKRLRIDLLHKIIHKYRAVKTTPKRQNQSGLLSQLNRTDSDVSWSETLYDTLFSEDDSKTDDQDTSKNRPRNKSLDVSDVVTACLDNMAAKTGISKIQKQSHMDRWLQKAKSKTPEKPQANLFPIIQIKETKTIAKKAKNSPAKLEQQKKTIDGVTPNKPYSLRKFANDSHLDDNLGSIRIMNAFQINEHDYSKLTDCDPEIKPEDIQPADNDVGTTDISKCGIGFISKVETLCDKPEEWPENHVDCADCEIEMSVTTDDIVVTELKDESNFVETDIVSKLEDKSNFIETDVVTDLEDKSNCVVDKNMEDNPSESQAKMNVDTLQDINNKIYPMKLTVASLAEVTTSNDSENEESQISSKMPSNTVVSPSSVTYKLSTKGLSIVIESNNSFEESSHTVATNKDKIDDDKKEYDKVSNEQVLFNGDIKQNCSNECMTSIDNILEREPSKTSKNEENKRHDQEINVEVHKKSESHILKECSVILNEHTSPMISDVTKGFNEEILIKSIKNCSNECMTSIDNILEREPSKTSKSEENKRHDQETNVEVQKKSESHILKECSVILNEHTSPMISDVTKGFNEEMLIKSIQESYSFGTKHNYPKVKSRESDLELEVLVKDEKDKKSSDDIIVHGIDKTTSENTINNASTKEIQDLDTVEDIADKFSKSLEGNASELPTKTAESNLLTNDILNASLKTNKVENSTDGNKQIGIEAKTEISKARKDPEFMKYFVMRQDALIDENPQFTEDDVLSYLYKTWLYEVDRKSDHVKTDEIEQSNLVKGLSLKSASRPKKDKKLNLRRKHKHDKSIIYEKSVNPADFFNKIPFVKLSKLVNGDGIYPKENHVKVVSKGKEKERSKWIRNKDICSDDQITDSKSPEETYNKLDVKTTNTLFQVNTQIVSIQKEEPVMIKKIDTTQDLKSIKVKEFLANGQVKHDTLLLDGTIEDKLTANVVTKQNINLDVAEVVKNEVPTIISRRNPSVEINTEVICEDKSSHIRNILKISLQKPNCQSPIPYPETNDDAPAIKEEISVNGNKTSYTSGTENARSPVNMDLKSETVSLASSVEDNIPLADISKNALYGDDIEIMPSLNMDLKSETVSLASSVGDDIPLAHISKNALNGNYIKIMPSLNMDLKSETVSLASSVGDDIPLAHISKNALNGNDIKIISPLNMDPKSVTVSLASTVEDNIPLTDISKNGNDIESKGEVEKERVLNDHALETKLKTSRRRADISKNAVIGNYIESKGKVEKEGVLNDHALETKPKILKGRPKKKTEIDIFKKNAKFMKYVEMRRDALMDENPHFTENDIIMYLHQTWTYEEDLKSDHVKNDEIDQANLVKGLGETIETKSKKLKVISNSKKLKIYITTEKSDSDLTKSDIEDNIPISEISKSVKDNETATVSPDKIKEKPRKKQKANQEDNAISKKIEIEKAKEDPKFLKYLGLHQDSLIDENPHVSEADIILYLYKSWVYEENLKSEHVKNDDIELSNLVKGLGDVSEQQQKKLKKKIKLEKTSQPTEVVSPNDKPKRKVAKAYYNEDDTDIETELKIFEIFKMKSKNQLTPEKPVLESSHSKESKSESSQEIVVKVDPGQVKQESEEVEEEYDEVECFFEELTEPKPNVFKGLARERVCEICERTNDLVKCKGPCAGMFHLECVKKEFEPVVLVQNIKTRGRKRKKPRGFGRKSGSLDGSESQSDEKQDNGDEQNISFDDSQEHIIVDLDSFETQLETKMKEIIEKDTNPDYDSYESDDESNWKDTIAGKCEIVDVKPKLKLIDQSDFKCNNCKKYDTPICFVCKSPTSPKNNKELRQKCQVAHCHKYYHLECLDHWPQTQFNSGEPSRNNKKISEHFEALSCPRHVCHTCVCDDPRGCKTRFSGDKLARCVRCPATYHSFTKCLPAGTTILSGSLIICPRHYEHRPGKVPCHVNTGWCFLCALGGTLICCEYCPTSFHAECLNIATPEGNYMCEDCETGRLPLYNEMVWVKLGHYRWWPGIILHPSSIPDNIMSVKHSRGEFVVRFFGQYDHYWVNRGRVFPFQEGDNGRVSGQKSKIDEAFTVAIEHARRACEVLKKAAPNEVEETDIASSLLPPHYVKLKVNKPCGTLLTWRPDDEENSLTLCECDPREPAPCGPDSHCLNRMLLTECGPTCRAGDRCHNRSFEKRLYPKLVPYRTPHRGWGLKTLEAVKKGQFVIEYVGELIDEDEFKRRMQRKHEMRDENFYFLTLDKDRMIDAGPKGNLARFMNHCCEPNCETQKWTVLGDVRVGLFAMRDIPANTEVTFNYNLECAGIDKKKCMCGARRCSGYIGAKPKQLLEDIQPKKIKVPKRKYTKKSKKTEDSPSTSKTKVKKQPKPKELTEIEKDLLIIKNATNNMPSSDSECGGRLSSIDRDEKAIKEEQKALKRKRVSFSTEEVILYNGETVTGTPSVKRAKIGENSVSKMVENGVHQVGD